jgi:ribonuclease BN (tRNA processing enzyme)
MKTIFTILFCLLITSLYGQRDFSDSETTKLVLLGTGTPFPNPLRSGCSIAIVVNDMPYIVDFGPGLIRKAAAMSESFGGNIKGLEIKNIKRAFLTHLHSDHTTGYPDLILTPWTRGRNEPLEVYGPEGIDDMTSHVLKAYEEDIRYRLYAGLASNNQGWRVNSHEIGEEGMIYQDENVKVEAFPVPHGSWPNAWGFRFTTPDKVIVISGDTSPSDKIKEYSKGADILVHGVYSKEKYDLKDESFRTYVSKHHTSTIELAEIAKAAQPKLVVLYHILDFGATEQSMEDEISEVYKGKVVLGHDLDTF